LSKPEAEANPTADGQLQQLSQSNWFPGSCRSSL
jgi:hypothetical protein